MSEAVWLRLVKMRFDYFALSRPETTSAKSENIHACLRVLVFLLFIFAKARLIAGARSLSLRWTLLFTHAKE